MKRIAVIDNKKLTFPQKKHVESICPQNRMGIRCVYFEGNQLRMDENLCNDISISICAKAFPNAIKLVRLPEKLGKPPIFRYGKNSFMLYNLPMPSFGKVLGLVGSNAIGKSTALKILSNQLKPNFGKETADDKEIINSFKGTEAQNYFKRLYEGKLKINYKPQNIDILFKDKGGKTSEFLDRIKSNDEIIRSLELDNILEKDISTLSGGELQKIAIAKSVIEPADIYLFDEPTTYLDIEERLKVITFIKTLAKKDTAVVVIEHDLIVLDYLSDIVQIFYGESSAYGIVSGYKNSRDGINEYLEGYLRRENIKFRPKPIAFKPGQKEVIGKKLLVILWDELTKGYENFSLKVAPGSITSGDIAGILGPNATGKTTFINLLADKIKPDSGIIKDKVLISYKQQYISKIREPDALVNSYLSVVLAHNSELLTILNLEPLLERKLDQLSGGELQRVAIARSLSTKADIYLLDEPSAFLDIEERLVVSKLLKDWIRTKKTSCIVADHDLFFIDYLSDKFMVFSGVRGKFGDAIGPMEKERAMNIFLKKLGITFRRDKDTSRPRLNTPGSVKDRQQKSQGRYYY